ncbi:bifunctional [glutamate--ammonia ligase]-adenylyl-L-tyrosine phosphorylase/[glutamate--ammonia-ligase] adenylyltransferase [Beggiatoa leptomitoformis]|uniref:Bifunctional glutamine synthetase adenylyltransferase/adenylyl-removing enzyme n=1 Tax=Beggiatoa leptomitoformis TaxID=288004 RepID=A0A2N9YF52_9GAMM|nr:bifunctional [glutamate--ammonia ligase]-adenylyl-L-tyrosine phosphorylase/[glutamate--ammonia-ligase] adenylyltransferase [Beggiatoa leptomitoformis]ALG68659.1 bifunctional [glutamate--ammonia ligase]-adenylyl-L-tyrosine phosphorylase/[glutamate--ammonia-ligase] adenylyltransferase [Beggiatoa leptomitoformis]AUI68989.1 bifunctional [glutamate--ammonia ligase]-adenylyl-L-tyrosine phosphorylase/[glutamate--ammonia-ligase] adenylyltransferase [Beggiatoa leptomitoformis]
MNIKDKIILLPALLQIEAQRLWEDFCQRATPAQQQLIERQATIAETLPLVWACSPFVARHCVQYPQLLEELINTGDLFTPPEAYPSHLDDFLGETLDEISLMQKLRLFRRREMVRIAWRDLTGWASVEETLKSLSNLADALIDGSLTRLYTQLCKQFGTPCDKEGIPQSLIVLGMGKLGGQELNFSSDIDLIFVYPQGGETVGGIGRARDNQEFFTRLGQQLINSLHTITADGFVFRVDMRLRPFGDSGSLVLNFNAVEEYYQLQARDWERYAMIKARVVAGDKKAGQTLLNMLRPFIYRRYLDYNAFESLRNMKAMIDQEAKRKGLENNIKLGMGGIREVEFTCQTFQLIRGGRQPALQQRHLLTTLTQLEKYRYLSTAIATGLREAYLFLRLAENHLQAIDDRQTQTLPDDALNRLRLAWSLGFTDWADFSAVLADHQTLVHTQFQTVITPLDTSTVSVENPWQAFWLRGLPATPDETQRTLLESTGYQQPDEALQHLHRVAHSHALQKLSRQGRERLDKLMPLLLEVVSTVAQKDLALSRLLDLISSIAQRSVYLSLLIERPMVLQQLVYFCANSAWIAEQITRYPLLMDELLDHRGLYDMLKPNELDNELNNLLQHLPADDLEMQMDCLRQFKRANVMRVATEEIAGNMTPMIASDYLAAIADTLVRRALRMAWDYLSAKHGSPQCIVQGQKRPAHFCIVAYGKAGGIELSYGSDLDIVFLHDSEGDAQQTDGDKPIENSVFFIRLAQRIIHILVTNMAGGLLYEVDPRLRPGGASGLLVSSFDAFYQYQHQAAWTWEHQALVRARAIAGYAECLARFETIRHEILSLSRDPEKLRLDVLEMRQKMRSNLDKSTTDKFDIKQGYGGIVDIEFIIQYAALRWSHDYANLLTTTGVIPMLKRLAEHQLIPELASEQLGSAYHLYRAETHRLALQNQAAYLEPNVLVENRQQVRHWWQKIILLE